MFGSLQKGWKPKGLRWEVSEWYPMWEAQGRHKLLRERRRYYELHLMRWYCQILFLAHLFFGYIHFFRFLYNPDPCNPNPCQNGGTCNPHGPGTVTCNCPPHCAGLACEICEGNCRFLQHKNWYVNLNFRLAPWIISHSHIFIFQELLPRPPSPLWMWRNAARIIMLLSIVWDCVEGQETMQIFRKKQHVKSSNQKLTDAGKDLGHLSNGLATKEGRKQ